MSIDRTAKLIELVFVLLLNRLLARTSILTVVLSILGSCFGLTFALRLAWSFAVRGWRFGFAGRTLCLAIKIAELSLAVFAQLVEVLTAVRWYFLEGKVCQ